MSPRHPTISASSAFAFVLTMGIVNLFADMTYEGGAGINGPYLASLGASAPLVSFIAGLGEFLGYTLRSLAGWVADRTGRYWPITFLGYVINLLAVPAMSLAGNWQAAAALILTERIGRAIRKPTVEAMLSYSTGKHGRGWVYAVNTALDETGATLGPLCMGVALYGNASYRTAYSLLLVPALLALAAVIAARLRFPVPSQLEEGGPPTAMQTGFGRSYWLYTLAGSFFGAGLMSFEFLSYHLAETRAFEDHWVPVLLSMATLAAIAASLILGRLYDRAGLGAIVAGVLLASFASPLIFLGETRLVLVGLALWGVGYAVQDTLLKVLIASVLPERKRNFAFGLFYLGYGAGWLVGSITTGLLYEYARSALVPFVVAMQLLSLPLFVMGSRRR